MSAKKITKYDLIDSVSEKSCCEKKLAQAVLENFLDELRFFLSEGTTVELRGFGTFEARFRKGRTKARNPKTGEQLSVAPHYVAAFRAGQDLKNALRRLPVESNGTE
jgi:integration host factor subunit beta